VKSDFLSFNYCETVTSSPEAASRRAFSFWTVRHSAR